MGMVYSANAYLDFEYSRENVRTIMRKGALMGFFYVKDEKPMSPDEAADHVINFDLHYCDVFFQDTVFALFLSDGEFGFYVSMALFGGWWEKRYQGQNKYDHDMYRYGRLLLELISDYKMNQFSIALEE